jgi:hypothetical protein
VGRDRLDALDNVAFHGRNPIDAGARRLLRLALLQQRVVGLVTSAFLEAAIVGRPVLTFTLPEYRMHQEEMIHFRYLLTWRAACCTRAPDLDAISRSCAEALAGGGARDERNRRFLGAFVRPGGLDVPATPALRTPWSGCSARTDAGSLARRVRGLRPMRGTAASWSRTAPAAWLMNDLRDRRVGRARARRPSDRCGAAVRRRMRASARRSPEGTRRRRDAWMLRGKEAKSALRAMRFRTAMFAHRILAMAGIGRGDVTSGEKH